MKKTQSIRATAAAGILHQVCKFWHLLRQEAIPPFKDGQGNWFTMHQFRRFFNTSRTPKPQEDIIESFFKTNQEGSCPDHVVVLHKGQFYSLSPFDNNDQLCNPEGLAQAFMHIENQQNHEAGLGIGPLSSEDRDVWAHHHFQLQKANPKVMHTISSAICLFILSDLEPTNHSDQLKWTLVNDGRDIWADKSLTFVAFNNGIVGSQSDHSPFDGMVSAEVCGFCLQGLTKQWSSKTTKTNEATFLPKVEPLEITVPKETQCTIPQAIQALDINAKDLQMDYHVFESFGKSRLKELRLHPDAFVQVVLQAAVFKTHAKALPTYETATTRQFYHGRTETVRSCTQEALEFAKALTLDEMDHKEQRERLKIAIAKQCSLMEQCKRGQGCDRHLLGLKLMALESELELPKLFLDPSYKASGGDGNYLVSTSLAGYGPITGGCPPMVRDGYGVFYGIPNNNILVWITTYNSSQFSKPSILKANLFELLSKTEKLCST